MELAVQVLDSVESKNKWFSAKDAKKRNAECCTLYTEEQKVRAERMKMALSLVYDSIMFIDYRKKFIAVKVQAPQVTSSKQLALLELAYAEEGIKKVVTAQGVIYRIARK